MAWWPISAALLALGFAFGYALKRAAGFFVVLGIGALLLGLGLGPLDGHGGFEGPDYGGIGAALLLLLGWITAFLGAGGILGAMLSKTKLRARRKDARDDR